MAIKTSGLFFLGLALSLSACGTRTPQPQLAPNCAEQSALAANGKVDGGSISITCPGGGYGAPMGAGYATDDQGYIAY